MNEVFIVSAMRTAIAKSPRGSLRHTRPDDLAAHVVSSAISRAGVDPALVEDVILGCAQPEFEQGLNIGRLAALRAGLPQTIPGLQINRFCASGLEAIAIAAQRIACGGAEVIVAGGVESMTRVNFLGESTRPNPALLRDLPNTYLGMGMCVEQLSSKFGVTREECDAFSVESHTKALAAQSEGKFAEEITPFEVQVQVDGQSVPATTRITLNKDEGPREGTSLEGLAKLKPAFCSHGILTAGNASQRSDGAAAVLLASGPTVSRLGLSPLLRFVSYSVAAVEPENFGIGPAIAAPTALKQARLSIDQMDVIEFNEAFAAQVICSMKEFPMPMDRVNVNGGAIALGHPLGCTGARQTASLAYELRRRNGRYGMVTMCAALGMGAAGIFERV